MRTNLNSSSFALSILFTLLISISTAVMAEDKPITQINNAIISEELIEDLIQRQVAKGERDTPELRRVIRDQLIRLELLSQHAKATKLDKEPEAQRRIDALSKEILSQSAINAFVRKNPVTELEIKAEYDRLVAQAAGRSEFFARHILVSTEDEANDIIKKLASGAAFADLAVRSKDVGSAKSGGELGWSDPDVFVASFAEALKKLEKGKFSSQPVKTDFGYHVIQLDDLRPIQPPSFDVIKPQILSLLTRQKIEDFVEGLRKKAKIK